MMFRVLRFSSVLRPFLAALLVVVVVVVGYPTTTTTTTTTSVTKTPKQTDHPQVEYHQQRMSVLQRRKQQKNTAHNIRRYHYDTTMTLSNHRKISVAIAAMMMLILTSFSLSGSEAFALAFHPPSTSIPTRRTSGAAATTTTTTTTQLMVSYSPRRGSNNNNNNNNKDEFYYDDYKNNNNSNNRKNSNNNDDDDFDHNTGGDWKPQRGGDGRQDDRSGGRGRRSSDRQEDFRGSSQSGRGGRGGSGGGRRGGPDQSMSGRTNHRNNNNGGGRSSSRSQRGGDETAPVDREASITDTNAHFFSKKSLQDPSLSMADKDLFQPLCQGAGITRPSRIQSMAWPQILKGQHTIVADQTGSGKTLAYLLPLLQRALSSGGSGGGGGGGGGKSKSPGAPKVLILAPTAELADQIREVCRSMAETVPFNTMVVSATGKHQTSIRDQIRRLQRTPVDVLISTPGRVSTILRTRNSGLDLSNLQAIVLDEVDILLIDETFGPQLRTVGAAAPLNQTQFVFVTATLPDQIVQTVEEEFPGVVQVRGPGLHRVAPSLKERLVDVSVPAERNRDKAMGFDLKAKQLLQALRQNRCRRTLIFCNTVESCREVENLMNRKDRRGQVFEVSAYHNAMTPENRNANLNIFSKGRQYQENGENVDYILICTDRAARGVDFDAAPVDHVVIFDFPKDPAEYVRRVGRTARAGRTGASTVFAYGWQLPVARQVMGKKLDSFTIAANSDLLGDKERDEEKFQFQKNRRTRKTRDTIIKENIENGSLWDK